MTYVINIYFLQQKKSDIKLDMKIHQKKTDTKIEFKAEKAGHKFDICFFGHTEILEHKI